MNIIAKAEQFAVRAHDSIKQVRKYTGDPYWTHTRRVAQIVSSVIDDLEAIAAAHLHDVLEDVAPVNPEFSEETIRAEFGDRVLNIVKDLTDEYIPENYPKMNRNERKAAEAQRLSRIAPISQTIKYADLIDNTADIVKHDLKFARTYLREKSNILKVMSKGDPELYRSAFNMVARGKIIAYCGIVS